MIVEGINVIRELLKANSKIDKIIVEIGKNQEINEIVNLANKNNVMVETVDKKQLERITKSKTQGVIAFVPNFKYAELKDIFTLVENKNEKPFIVILDGIVDPHNLGAIIRTCECAGVHGVIIPENRACDVNDTVYKTSAGAVSHMLIVKVVNLSRTIDELKKTGVWVYALEAGSKRIYECDFSYPTALVIGSEGKGVSRLIKEHSDEIVSIDLYGKVNSLNASNAAAIAVYEVVRQRRIDFGRN